MFLIQSIGNRRISKAFNYFSKRIDEEIEDIQYASFQYFKNKWLEIQACILDEKLSYYTTLREELGFSDNSNKDYPLVSSTNEINDLIELDMILIPMSGIYGGRCVGLAFECAWDDENELGVLLVDEKIEKIGYQDIMF